MYVSLYVFFIPFSRSRAPSVSVCWSWAVVVASQRLLECASFAICCSPAIYWLLLERGGAGVGTTRSIMYSVVVTVDCCRSSAVLRHASFFNYYRYDYFSSSAAAAITS